MSPSELIPFPGTPGAEQHANAETKRKHRLYAWADDLLQQLGLVDRVSRANSVQELRKVTFDADAVEVGLAIRDALHPTSGQKADIFAGLREGSLKRVLNNRFNELKKEREAQLLRGQGVAGRRQSAHSWTDDLKLDDKGGIRPLLTNLILFLRNHQKWAGVIAYDEFKACVVIRERPPWEDAPPDAPWTDQPWSDHHESLARVWFQREDIIANHGDVARAVQAAARHNPFHPVRDYFEALVWDGIPRLDTWLPTYFHADDTEYTRAIGPRFLIGAAARISKPGSKVDHTPVFEGPQGKHKSEALRTLAIKDEWFTDRLSHVASKDAALEMAGVLLVEIAEMDALIRASSSASKGFLSRRHDRFRPPYGKHPISLPRQCVFAGTINPVVGGYLKDATGSRRIWPVACHGTIDLKAIERDRDQLWAEAVARFKADAPWWLDTSELEALATAEQAARFKVDVWKEPVEQWLGKRKDVSISEVLQHALGIAKRDQTQAAQNRVVRILTDPDLGFTKYRPRKGRKRQNRYWREKC
jgi:predicted P-loop ATPase